MSDTPKTDPEVFSVNRSRSEDTENWQRVVPAEFARNLERENAKLEAERTAARRVLIRYLELPASGYPSFESERQDVDALAREVLGLPKPTFTV